MSVLYLGEGDVAATLTMRDALRLLEAAAREHAGGTAMNQPRERVRAGKSTLHVLPAALGGYLGHKCYTTGARAAKFWVTLYAASGEMLAIIEADRLGALRTGAASGIASRALARPDAAELGIIGTGNQARTQAAAVCAMLPIARVRAYGRDPVRRAAFASEMQAALERPVLAVETARDAVEGADVIVTITSATEPVLFADDLREGVHINAAGANRLPNRELDVAVVARATTVAVEDVAQAQVESADLREAVDAGAFGWNEAVRLADIIAGTAVGRRNPSDITLFKSLGIGLWDVAVAAHVFETARSRGLGTHLPIPA